MALNYGLGDDFTTVFPVVNSTCVFGAIDDILRPQGPDQPGHSDSFPSLSVVNSKSVIHILNHSFKSALPNTDKIIQYYISMYHKDNGSIFDQKVAEFNPVLSRSTTYNYIVDEKIRVGEYFSQNEIDACSFYRFSTKRKSGSAEMGGDGNVMSYVVMSPFSVIL